jgi:hypothetical protein
VWKSPPKSKNDDKNLLKNVITGDKGLRL